MISNLLFKCNNIINSLMLNILDENIYKNLYSYYGKYRGKLQYYIPSKGVHAHKITENLFIGDIHSPYNKNFLKDNDISTIITAIAGMEPIYPKEFEYLNINIIDINTQEIIDQFDSVNEFIDSIIEKNEKILVHCVCGVSRSVSLVIAYLIYSKRISFKKALEIVKEKRDIANPNDGFVKQLIEYQNHLGIKDN